MQQDTQATPITDRVDYRRHRGACPYYRENWTCESDDRAAGEELLYQIICLMDTPPLTDEEQDWCLHAASGCWRSRPPEARRNGHSTEEKSKVRTRGRKNGRGRWNNGDSPSEDL